MNFSGPAEGTPATQLTEAEVASQPEVWAEVLDRDDLLALLPATGRRVLGVGCGTSYYILDAWARLRGRRDGHTRAVIASEFDGLDGEDTALFLSRSGTTADLLRVAEDLRHLHTIAITGTADSPITKATRDHVLLDFADEQSVVQTRFATATLTLLRRAVADPGLADITGEARRLLAGPPAIDPRAHDHIVILGTGWNLGLAHEAALKLIESSRLWAEAYPILEYLHGPIAAAGPRTLVWSLAAVPDHVATAITATGATLRVAQGDPQVELVEVHRTAIAYAKRRGIDCDSPPHLSRSVTA